MSTPGAVISGLIRSRLPAGPRELKPASWSGVLLTITDGNGMVPTLVLALALAKSRNRLLSAWLATKAGTVAPVTVGVSPVAWLLAMITATAPAAAALATLSVKLQVPRRTTATASWKVPAG